MENIKYTSKGKTYYDVKGIFQPDPRWSIFEGAGSLDQYIEKFLFPECLGPDVDKTLLEQEVLIKKLLLNGYFEYEFITVAIHNSFLMFEVGLKIYFKNLTGTEFQGTLHKLIEQYEKLSIINRENRSVLDMIRHIRNHFAHPKAYTVVPPAVIGIIKLVLTVINDLEKIHKERSSAVENI